MSLTFVSPGSRPTTWNALLYGPPGTGKTIGACSAPGPVLLINAEGPGAMHYAYSLFGEEKIHEVAFEGAQTLEDAFLHLQEGGEEKTLVIDSLGEVYTCLAEEMGGARPSLQNYGDVNTKLGRMIRSLRDIEVNLVLVAHEQLDGEGEEQSLRPKTGGRKLPELVMAQVDIVAYTGVILETDDAPRRFVGQFVPSGGRRCKDRSGSLGVFRDLDLTEWFSTASKAMASKKTNKEEK